MNTLRPIRLRLAWRQWPKGHIIPEMPAAAAQMMVEAGQAEYVTTPILNSPANRMMVAEPVKRKRGRPRKHFPELAN